MPVVVIIVLLVVVVLGLLLMVGLVINRGQAKRRKKQPQRRDRETVIRQANRQLAGNPRDHRALLALADLYFEEQSWEKAMKTYGILVDQCATNSEIEEWQVSARFGIAALQLKHVEEAYKSLMVARTLKEDSFEINYNLGFLEYRRGNQERAVQLLKQAREERPEHLPSLRYQGRALAKLKRYNEAVPVLRQVVEVEPEDKESMFFLAQGYFELGRTDQALPIFSHLRADPQLGPHAALYAGTIRASTRDLEKATLDFEIGLRHEKIQEPILLELRYRLADVYSKQQDLSRALTQLSEINKINPAYKDVSAQISRSKELHSNQNLQTYLIAPTSEFVALCRRMVMTFFKNAKIKITDVNMQKNEYADILTEVETAQWEDIILFRFIRGTGQVGELVVRDFNARLKETRAGRGFCITGGSFSESAVFFVEARLIDLLDKEKLLEIFNLLD